MSAAAPGRYRVPMPLLIATESRVLVVDERSGRATDSVGLDGRRPTDVAFDRRTDGRAWCAVGGRGVLRSDDGGRSWQPAGLDGLHVMTVVPSPSEPHVVWAGTEPSQVHRSDDGGRSWRRVDGLDALPSSSEWAFPPKPETHHVRWIAPHPHEPGRLWVAIEAGALVELHGGTDWRDRAGDGPYDTHELAIHPDRPDTLHVAAGDGPYRSDDGGRTWTQPRDGLDIGYLRSIAVDPGDPDVVIASGATGPRSTYVAGRADGRLYRREGRGAWRRVLDGWPADPSTIAPLLRAGRVAGELWAADERGLHRSDDGGRSWHRVAGYDATPNHLRGLAVS